MTLSETRDLLNRMTGWEKAARAGNIPEMDEPPAEIHFEYENDNVVMVLVESGLDRAPVDIEGYEDAAKNFRSLNIVCSKHTRYSVFGMHRHEFIEIAYMLSGSTSFIINGKEVPVKKGDLCVMDSNVVHKVQETGEDDILLNILIPKRYFDKAFFGAMDNAGMAVRFFGEVISPMAEHDRFWLSRCSGSLFMENFILMIFSEFLEPDMGSASVIKSCLNLIMIEAARCWEKDRGYVEESEGEGGEILPIMKILHYISEECAECTLKETSKHFGYSPSYLSRKLKEVTGKSFSDLLCEERLSISSMRLRNSDIPVNRIAEETGYRNMSFFYRKFQEKYGMTPGEYRELSRNS